MVRQDSPFLSPGGVTKANTLAIIQLSKDDLIPVYLRDTQGEQHDGYKEGHVLNTRFGSFPHSTLIGIPWGSQVRASNVDTGSRGRRKKSARQQQAKVHGEAAPLPVEEAEEGTSGVGDDDTSGGPKRKRDPSDDGEKRIKRTPCEPAKPAAAAEDNTAAEPLLLLQEAAAEDEDEPTGALLDARDENGDNNNNNNKTPSQSAAAVAAAAAHKQSDSKATTAAKSGFVHILPPTPEIWTSSLPHRTQVVYTPDYSYILQRIRARPGSRLIEAGSGSGSFTHASARAVYGGSAMGMGVGMGMGCHDGQGHHLHQSTGKVFSFEFHEQRFEKMKREISEHGLSGMVHVNHRDVYNEGFLVDGKSPEADAVFLDLPAPWLALPHLSRRKPRTTGSDMDGVEGGEDAWISPLHPKKSVYICTFSPCIEQVTRTVSEMRKLGWVEIDMVEISHRRMQVYREKIGLNIVSERGMQLAPKDVAEAVAKLKEIEVRAAEHNAKMVAFHGKKNGEEDDGNMDDDDDAGDDDEKVSAQAPKVNGNSVCHKVEVVEQEEEENKEAALKPFMQGQLVTRTEPETKAHTSYLVFAILPREWTEEEEAAAAAKWPIGKEQKVIGAVDRASRKQQKRELMQNKSKKNQKGKQESKKHAGNTIAAAEVSKEEVQVEAP